MITNDEQRLSGFVATGGRETGRIDVVPRQAQEPESRLVEPVPDILGFYPQPISLAISFREPEPTPEAHATSLLASLDYQADLVPQGTIGFPANGLGITSFFIPLVQEPAQ